MVGHRSSRGGVKDSLEVRPRELCHLDVADDREDEALAVRRLLFPVALAPAPAPGRGSRQVKVVLNECASPGAPSASNRPGRPGGRQERRGQTQGHPADAGREGGRGQVWPCGLQPPLKPTGRHLAVGGNRGEITCQAWGKRSKPAGPSPEPENQAAACKAGALPTELRPRAVSGYRVRLSIRG